MKFEKNHKVNLKHGHCPKGAESGTHVSWRSMKSRCTNQNDERWPLYGGRGIRVCDRWKSFDLFLEDMGEKPTRLHSIDRINNDGNYEPSNCRWATKSEQSNNRRTNRVVSFNGITSTITSMARNVGLTPNVVLCRLRMGWTLDSALSAPVQNKRKRAK